MSMKSYLPRAFVSGIQLSAIGIICIITCTASMGYADWKSDANARIEQIRKRDALITVVDAQGNPVPNLGVQIDQIKHRFAFGTALAYSPLSNNSDYRNFVLDHFEWAVCENESKWPANEGSRDSENYYQADYIYNWCSSNGITMRGHTLLWEQTSMVQTWVQDLPYATYPTSSELLDEVDERIDHAVSHFRNKFVHWDVDNEMLPTSSGYQFYNRLGETGRVHMFQRANSAAGECMLFMNEYSGNSFGGYDGWTYRDRANSLISMGAPIHGLGIQGHVASPFNPQSYYSNVLEPLRQVGRPIFVTEFDVDQPDAALRANDLENFYRICFSHPSVEGILMWGFWQNAMWRSNAYIVNSDWTVNEAGLRYEALLDEWTTHNSGIIDVNGTIDFRGIHGTYTVTLTSPGYAPEVHTIVLDPGTGTAAFPIETALPPPLPDTIAPSAPTGLFAAPGEGKVTLNWNDNTEQDLDSYAVYRSIRPGAGYGLLASGIETSDYVDIAVSNDTTYYYVVTARDFWLNESDNSNEDSATPALAGNQYPYPGPAPHAIPGRIEAENYDLGGEGLAFHDSDSANEGAAYRTDGVDVEACGEGGYNVGWIASGEWLEYTVDVAATGFYDIELRVASNSNGGTLHIEFDGVNATGSISFPATGGWQTYTSVYVNNVRLTRGLHVMRISMDATYFNMNWLDFTPIPYGDFTGNRIVNSDDLPGFFEIWLSSNCGDPDINDDCVINLSEFAELAKYWLDASFQ